MGGTELFGRIYNLLKTNNVSNFSGVFSIKENGEVVEYKYSFDKTGDVIESKAERIY